jgi:hypothetical protein
VNPVLFGLVVNGVFANKEQHDVSRTRMLTELYEISGRLYPEDAQSDDDDDDDDDDGFGPAPQPLNAAAGPQRKSTAQGRVQRELKRLDHLRQEGFRPQMTEARAMLGKIAFGAKAVTKNRDFERGDGSKDNLMNYYKRDSTNFDIVHFYKENKTDFPILWVYIQKVASMVGTEAGSERLFSYAGMIMQPKRASLGTKTYERLVTCKCNMDNVYVLPEDIESEFLARKAHGWAGEVEQENDDRIYMEAEEEFALDEARRAEAAEE